MHVPKINLLFISSVLEEWDTRYANWDDAASVFVVVVVVVVAIGVHFELMHTNRRLLRLKIGMYWSDTEKKITTLGILIRKDFFIYPMKTLNTWFNNRFNKSSLLMQCNKNVFPVLMAQWIREFWSNEEKTIIRCCDVKSIIWYPFLYLFADLIAYTFSVLEAQAA